MAGSYPAFYLSSFKPISVLKSKGSLSRFSANKNNFSLRSVLVVFQFVVSVSLIVGTTVVYKQLSYIQNIKLGYDKEQLLVMRNSYLLGNNEAVLKEQLMQDPRVASITTCGFLPAGPTNNNQTGESSDDKKEER